MPRFARRVTTGALIGSLAMALALVAAFLASQTGIPYAPVALGQAIIEVLPGWIAVPLIELLQFWAQRLLVAGVLALYLVAGAAAGVVALDPRRRDAAAIAAGLAPWLVTLALGAAFAGSQIDVGGALVDAAAGAAVFFAALAALEPAGARESRADGPSRRRALLGTVALATLVAVVGLPIASRVRSAVGRAEGMLQAARRLRHRETGAAPDPAFEAIRGLVPRITSNADHYTVDTALLDPAVDVTRWKLEVSGAVEAPFSLGYDELLELEAVEQLHTLECISNEIGGDLISTALWTGVPLRDLLARARPRADAFDVILHSVDAYTDSIRLAKALEPQTIVAYLMNGYRLPVEHGFPARVLVPNIYGMKNVKWIEKIEVATFDYLGYWMERGWSDVAVMNTHSRIDVPGATVKWSGSEIAIAGIANAGSRGVARVEVSTDGGASWSDAELEPALGSLTWRRWRLLWLPPATGTYKLRVRATDGTGQVQTATRRQPFPDGTTGHHAGELAVQRG